MCQYFIIPVTKLHKKYSSIPTVITMVCCLWEALSTKTAVLLTKLTRNTHPCSQKHFIIRIFARDLAGT